MNRVSDRRTVLRGLLGGAVVQLALPTLQFGMSSRAWACGGGLPKRFGLYFWGNGNRPEKFTPAKTGSGDAWSLPDELAPLQRHKDVICVPSGLSVRIPNRFPHSSGAGGILAGAPLREEAMDSIAAPTIDQLVANGIGRDTLYPSLQTAATNFSGLSYSGPNQKHPAEFDPYAMYQRLFGDTFVEPGGEAIVDPRLGLRRSVLDAVSGDLKALQARVGAEDRVRLDQHATGVRELETRLARLQEDPPDLESCARPAEPLPAYPDEAGRPQIAARNKAMADLLAMALACDQTRVFAHFLHEPVSDTLFPDATAGHHSLTHDEPGDQPQVDMIATYCVERFADLVDSLRAVPEGGGTLLDSCLVMACTEVSLGRTHSLDDMPVVLAGSACGAIRQDVHVATSGTNASKLLLSVLRAMDIPAAEVGVEEGLVTDSLTEIEA